MPSTQEVEKSLSREEQASAEGLNVGWVPPDLSAHALVSAAKDGLVNLLTAVSQSHPHFRHPNQEIDASWPRHLEEKPDLRDRKP